MTVNNASVKRYGEVTGAVVVLGGGGGGAQGGKPTSPANVVVAMANARIVAARTFFGCFIFSS
jgi:hypothetical protein